MEFEVRYSTGTFLTAKGYGEKKPFLQAGLQRLNINGCI
jgi:hypothetical protein